VRLDAVTNPRDVYLAVAEAIGVPLDGADPNAGVRDRLLGYLANRRLLLVLDNCEHVVDAAAGLVDAVRSAASGVVVLATSREALAVSGEVQVSVGPLAAPPPGTPPERVLDHPAAQLFVERARAVRADWEPTAADLRAVGVVCHGLDGMPLAVELAAARMSSLSPAEIAERLDDRFSLLTTGPRSAQTRQRTLRGAVEWSHALLSASEKQVFRRLAVFQAGCTLTGAESVVVGCDVRPGDVLDLLGHLVERSMLVAEPGSPTRYRMLETLRRYGVEQLELAGETHATARRHAAYVLQLAEAAEPELRGRGQRSTLERLRAEHADLRAALDWLSAEPDRVEDALRLAGALGLYWHLGRHLEGRQVLRRLTEMPGGSPSARARALQAVSLVERPRACLVHPSPRCGQTAAQSLELFLGVGDLHRAALSRVLLAVELLDGSDPERFEDLLTAAEEQFTADGDDWGHAVVGFVRLQGHLRAGDEARARVVGRSAAHAFRALDDGWGLSAVLYHLGWGLREFGRYADAVPVLERAVDVARAAGMHNTAQWALADLGVALLYLGELDAGAECFDRADAASDEIGDAAGQVLAALGRGVLARIRGDVESARPLFESAREGLHRLGTPLWAGQALAGIAWCDWREGLLDDAEQRYQDVRDAGERSGEPTLVALGLEGTAHIAVRRADRVSAGVAVARAADIRRRAARPAPPHERAELAALDLEPQVQPATSDPAVTRA
jgi:predicted ATPase